MESKSRTWLADVRAKKKLTQIEAASRAGISRSMYNYIESGDRCPSVATAKKLSEVLGVKWTKFYE